MAEAPFASYSGYRVGGACGCELIATATSSQPRRAIMQEKTREGERKKWEGEGEEEGRMRRGRERRRREVGEREQCGRLEV